MADFVAINEIKKYIDVKIADITSNSSGGNPVPVNDVKLVKQGTSQEDILFTKTYVSNQRETVAIAVSNLYGACDWEFRVTAVANKYFGDGNRKPIVTAGYTLKLNNSTTNIANYNTYFTESTENAEGMYEASWVVNNTSKLGRYKKDIMPTDVFNLTTNFSCPSNISVTCTYQFKVFYDIIDQGNTNPHSVIKRLWHINPDDFWPTNDSDNYSNYNKFSTAFYFNRTGSGTQASPYIYYYYQKLPSDLYLNKTEILCPSGFNLYTTNRTIDYGTNKPSGIIIKEYY